MLKTYIKTCNFVRYLLFTRRQMASGLYEMRFEIYHVNWFILSLPVLLQMLLASGLRISSQHILSTHTHDYSV
jgi:hypothetical protein